jgi:cell division protease FtsH
VFPVQGVRPVFSTVNDVLESNMARFVFEALVCGSSKVHIYYDEGAQALCAELDASTTIRRPYVGRLDKIRQRSQDDVVANVSVHEAGHALVYGVLFGIAPLQLTSRVASSMVAGFTFPHDIHGTRKNIVSQIMVYLAGGIAEDVVFGPEHASIGRFSDREEASKLALDFVRRYGFDDEFQATYTLEYAHEMDKSVTDTDVEKMMARLAGETHKVLLQHSSLLIALATALAKRGELHSDTVLDLARQHGLELSVQAEGYLHLPGYAARLATAGDNAD